MVGRLALIATLALLGSACSAAAVDTGESDVAVLQDDLTSGETATLLSLWSDPSARADRAFLDSVDFMLQRRAEPIPPEALAVSSWRTYASLALLILSILAGLMMMIALRRWWLASTILPDQPQLPATVPAYTA